MKRLLHGVENTRSVFGEIAREIAQECGLRKPSFVAVQTIPADAGDVRHVLASAV